MRTGFTASVLLALLGRVLAADIISTSGFSSCGAGDSSIQVQNVDISFDRSTNKITFNVAGNSAVSQDVIASLVVEAYGTKVYNQTFDPCADDTKVDQLCPVPSGQFSAIGEQTIPSEYADKIPSIAYSIPDLDGMAKMVLTTKDGSQAACIESSVTNGKSVEVPAVQGVAAAIAAGALLFSAASAAMASGQPGASHSSPGFMEVMWWMQGMAMDGMLSVNYPKLYRSYTKNFAFSTGLVSWGSMQTAIDDFRSKTGGNLTDNNYEYLKNATLRFPDGTNVQPTGSFSRRLAIRALDYLLPRQLDGITTSLNGTDSATTGQSQESKLVSGIQAYAEQLTVPDANAFMTILLIFAVIIAIIVVGILLFKVVLEAWSLFGKFPKSLTTFRKEYWRIMAQTITCLILLLYGVWTLYCVYQFRNGDSWCAKALAGVTLGIFSALLGFYTWKIWSVAHKLKRSEGDVRSLYENKETWKKYHLFYENYKKQYWWLFMPFIIYMFAKGCILAGADGHGLVQSIGQLAVECIMLILLLWNRPFDRKSGNWINIIVQVVRVLSVACILVFVDQFGVARTTQTITGVVLIVVQATLTAILAILIATNALINCCKVNPHRKRRKAAAKAMDDDLEGDAFLLENRGRKLPMTDANDFGYDDMRAQAKSNRASRYGLSRTESEQRLIHDNGSQTMDVGKKGPYVSVRQHSPDSTPAHSISSREPRLPDIDLPRGAGQSGRMY
ncbi:hypothetical protein LTR05_004626 [Lithohypha guttulata]|uniref:ML-like domain-containing protein n=1 Tax=Lithohypha guttulata TaxID=1690604 RepID=A0AAN7SYU6_9EURO|nr:hypothetical protein LTR05_004626 [Lithohypha guttulata]